MVTFLEHAMRREDVQKLTHAGHIEGNRDRQKENVGSHHHPRPEGKKYLRSVNRENLIRKNPHNRKIFCNILFKICMWIKSEAQRYLFIDVISSSMQLFLREYKYEANVMRSPVVCIIFTCLIYYSLNTVTLLYVLRIMGKLVNWVIFLRSKKDKKLWRDMTRHDALNNSMGKGL